VKSAFPRAISGVFGLVAGPNRVVCAVALLCQLCEASKALSSSACPKPVNGKSSQPILLIFSERGPARRTGVGFRATLNLAGNFCKLEQGIEFDALPPEIYVGVPPLGGSDVG